MADIFDKDKRSDIMSRVRGKDTQPELLVYRYLRKEKVYFQKHYLSKERVRLDIALPRKKRTVFIDGDFWHGRTYDRILARRGKDDFWTKKLERNKERDKHQNELLTGNGWRVLRIWESDLMRIRTRDAQLEKIKDFLKN